MSFDIEENNCIKTSSYFGTSTLSPEGSSGSVDLELASAYIASEVILGLCLYTFLLWCLFSGEIWAGFYEY